MAALIPLLMLAGCGDNAELAVSSIQGSANLSGESALPLGSESDQKWLVTSKKQGLLLLGKDGQQLSHLEGHMELLDIRHNLALNGKTISLAASLDKQWNRPVLVSVSGNNVKAEANLSSPNFQVDGLCLYQDNQKHVYLFMLDGMGKAEQWLIYDGASESLAIRSVRELSMPPASSYCSVDDSTDTLYVSEEGLGVWAYGAHPEAKFERKPVNLVKPYGGESENIAGVAAVPGGILAVDPDTATVSAYKVADGEAEKVFSAPLKGVEVPESIAVSSGLDRLGVYDDEVDQYFSADFSWEKPEAATKTVTASILPEVQTLPVNRFGDVADDPAIWVNPDSPESSLVLGTNKKQGLEIYDLAGNLRQSFKTGHLNNVDVRYGFEFNGKTFDLATATNRTDNSIALFLINRSTGRLTEAGRVPTDLNEMYGTCMYQPASNEMHVFVNDKDGTYQQYQLVAERSQITGKKVRTFKVPSQPEGCVADDSERRLFVGEENVGIWVIGADADAGTELESIAKIGDLLHDDVEGLALYEQGEKSYLVVSSQGNDSYVIMDARPPYKARGAFRIGLNASKGIDGASETDGLDVTSANLGGVFSKGMLVVQDGRNQMPTSPQNFKYVPWESIQLALGLE